MGSKLDSGFTFGLVLILLLSMLVILPAHAVSISEIYLFPSANYFSNSISIGLILELTPSRVLLSFRYFDRS